LMRSVLFPTTLCMVSNIVYLVSRSLLNLAHLADNTKRHVYGIASARLGAFEWPL